MVQRIVKMIGSAYSNNGDVHVQATYNGIEILNGPVTATPVDVIPRPGELSELSSATSNELVQFETTTDITGQIPVTITVTGGTLFFFGFWMNYTGFVQAIGESSFSYNSAYPDQSVLVTTVEPQSFYSDPNFNTVESDGVSNLTKNGETWVWRQNVNDLTGDWMYPIRDGETVTFDFFVDPAKVILEVPIN